MNKPKKYTSCIKSNSMLTQKILEKLLNSSTMLNYVRKIFVTIFVTVYRHYSILQVKGTTSSRL